jgi:hypothetical protein
MGSQMLSLRWKAAIGMALALWIGLLVILLAWVVAGRRSGVGEGAERLKIGPEISPEALSAMYYRRHIGGTCLWSYYFVDPDRQKLERAVQWLKSDVFRIVSISGPVPREGGLRFILHFEKLEHFKGPEFLLARHKRLHAHARERGIESYEGMEVGILTGGRCQ